MVELYFRNSYDEIKYITKCTEDMVLTEINKFVESKNKEKTGKKFKIYYYRKWEEPDGTTWYDVGSHTEFFYTRKVVEYG